MKKYLVAIDQGTTSSRAVLFDVHGVLLGQHSIEFPQIYPKPGWVEHNPKDILASVTESLRLLLMETGAQAREIAAIGITNQRETAVLWDKKTGEPVYNAIVWQCRRTAPIVEKLVADGLDDHIRRTTGLIPDAYFAGTKLKWLLDLPGVRERAERGELCFGTIDTFLAWNLLEGRPHVTDAANASRTMLLNIETLEWDETLLKALDIPRAVLPEVVDNARVMGTLRKEILGEQIPVAAMCGDQQSSLFGQACFEPGMMKNTYGTGCFLLMNTGDRRVASENGLVTTIAWRLNGKICYALEGSVFVGGAVVQWLRDEMKLVNKASEMEAVALSVPDNGGVYLVPAFTGLGAPHWDMYARGTIVGLTRGTGRAHIVRAALESIAQQSADLVDAMAQDCGFRPQGLRVDGGASANNFLMQYQADRLGVRVERPTVIETTALGAAMMAGMAVGLLTQEDIASGWRMERAFAPEMQEPARVDQRKAWQRAVERAKGWQEK